MSGATLIQVPYHLGRKGVVLGAGPEPLAKAIGGDSIVVARGWITVGSTWGNSSFVITALDGGGRVLLQQRFDVPNNNTRVVELPGGSKLATVEGRTDPKAIPAAALVSLNR